MKAEKRKMKADHVEEVGNMRHMKEGTRKENIKDYEKITWKLFFILKYTIKTEKYRLQYPLWGIIFPHKVIAH